MKYYELDEAAVVQPFNILNDLTNKYHFYNHRPNLSILKDNNNMEFQFVF